MKNKFLNTLKTIFPSQRNEWFLFIFFLISYGVLATVIARDYRIIFDHRIPWDAYFSFDNRAIVLTGGGVERHPLANYFFNAIREVALLFSDGKMTTDFRLILAYFSVFTISLSIIQVFKYLKNITQLPQWLSFWVVVFYGLFSTNILLSFTPETYTYTLLFLCLFNYYAALKMRKNDNIPITALMLGAVTIGGLTITNIVKVYIPLLFEKHIFSKIKVFFNAFLRIVISVLAFMMLYLYRIDFEYTKIFTKATDQYERFSNPKVTPVWDMVLSWFLGGNILCSSFILRDYHNKKGFEYKALFMDVYTSWGNYIFVAIVLFLVIWAYIKNFKNKFVQVLVLSFLVDIVIHCILKFGLHTSYIYGGHFVFVYPLMLGWLFYSYRDSKVCTTIIFSLMIFLTVYLGINNWLRMQEFFQFLEAYYI